jgi:hypothetical protein
LHDKFFGGYLKKLVYPGSPKLEKKAKENAKEKIIYTIKQTNFILKFIFVFINPKAQINAKSGNIGRIYLSPFK